MANDVHVVGNGTFADISVKSPSLDQDFQPFITCEHNKVLSFQFAFFLRFVKFGVIYGDIEFAYIVLLNVALKSLIIVTRCSSHLQLYFNLK